MAVSIYGKDGALVSSSVNSARARGMLLAAKSFYIGGGNKNPYVTKGLVAMWDAMWNVGIDQHSNEAMILPDLSGNGYDLTVINDGTRRYWGADYFCVALFGTGQNNQCMFYLDDDDKSIELTNKIASCEFSINDTERGAFIYSSTSKYRNGYTVNSRVNGGNGLWVSELMDGSFGGTWSINYSPTSPSYSDMNSMLWHNGSRFGIEQKYATQQESSKKFAIGGIYGKNYTVYYGKFRFMRIYDRLLTDDEVLHNYTLDKARFGLA